MERSCSHWFVPFQPVCVRYELLNSAPERIIAQLTFAAGPCSSTLGQECRHVGASAPEADNCFTRNYTARQASQKTVLAVQAAPSGRTEDKPGDCDIAVVVGQEPLKVFKHR